MTESTIRNLLAPTDVLVPANFNGFAPAIYASMPPDLLDIDESVALGTIAAMYSAPDVHGAGDGCNLYTDRALAVRLLALYAAGARVRFTRSDYRALLNASPLGGVADEEAQPTLFETVDRQCVGMARNRAGMRAVIDGFYRDTPRTEGLVELNLDDGRGYGEMDSGLPADFHTNRQFTRGQEEQQVRYIRERLLTYAALFSVGQPRHARQEPEAIVMLALYGAGVRIGLSTQQFRVLERRAKRYIATMLTMVPQGEPQGPLSKAHYLRNAQMARYALRRATVRAKATGLI